MESPIQHVSDTALWVANYRAKETQRPDALFRDPFAEKLAGERGRSIVDTRHPHMGRQAEWSVNLRTVVIDDYIERLIAKGVNTIVNLGAGLDARPYRMKLPAALRWIEVDYNTIIDYKQKVLSQDKPSCQLEQISLDLADRPKRQQLFADIATRGQNILILSEGLLPYLTEEHVAELAQDLHAHKEFKYWVTEYYSSEIYKYFQNPKHMKFLKNAPFKFFPADWFPFFEKNGWKATEKQFLGEWGEKLKRRMPMPKWVFVFYIMRPFMSAEKFYRFRKLSAYVLFEPIP